jgi:GNAT superfamily N-acetyltransferase
MCAMIFDLLIDPIHREKGIGWKIMKKTVEFCLDKNIRNVGLTTDPSYPWLPDFYKKFGFTIDDSNGIYMMYSNISSL